MLLKVDPFSTYSTAQLTSYGMFTSTINTVGGGTFSIVTNSGRGGVGGILRINCGGTGQIFARYTFGPPCSLAPVDTTKFAAGFVWRPNTLTGMTGNGFFSVENGTTGLITLTTSAASFVEVRRGSRTGTVLGTSSVALAAGVFKMIELECGFNASTGTIDLYFDGVNVLHLTGQNTGTTAYTGYFLGLDSASSPSGTTTFDYSEFYFCDGSDGTTAQGAAFNTAFKDPKVLCLMPTADGNYTQFTPTPAGAHWSTVDENPATDDTDYVEDGTVGHRDSALYTFPAGVVAAVPLTAMKKTDALARSVRPFVRGGGVDYDGPTDIALSQVYQHYFAGVYAKDPSTSAAWASGSREFGTKVTV